MSRNVDITNVAGLGDIPQLNHWRFGMTMPSAVPGALSGEYLNTRCITTDVPKSSIGVQDINIRGHKVHQPGDKTIDGSITLTFYDNNLMQIGRFLREWKEACSATLTQVKKLTSSVKADVTLTLLNRQDEDIYRYILHGCFVTDSDGLGAGLSGDKNAPLVTPSLTLSYDWFEEENV